MRGRSLWRESPKTSSNICAFCLHKRFASFGALANSNDVTTKVTVPSRPAFGTPTFGKTTNTPESSTAASQKSGLDGQPAFGSNTIELTAEEKRLKAALAEAELAKQRSFMRVNKPFTVDGPRTGPGRKLPLRDPPRQQQQGQRGETPYRQQRAQGQGVIRRMDNYSGEPRNALSRDADPKQMNWGQLNRKGQTARGIDSGEAEGGVARPNNDNAPTGINRFERGRAEREAQAHSRQYTPLSPSSRKITLNPSPPSSTSSAPSSSPQVQKPIIRSDGREPFAQTIPSRSDGREPFASSLPRETGHRSIQLTKEDTADQHVSKQSTIPDTTTSNTLEASNTPATQPSSVQYKPIVAQPAPTKPDLTFEERQRLYEQAEARRPTPKAKKRVFDTPKRKTYEEPERRGGRDSVRGDKDSYKAKRRDRYEMAYDIDDDVDAERAAAAAIRAEERRRKKQEKAAKKAASLTPIFLPEYISVGNLASAVKVKPEKLAEKMLELGFEEAGPEHILNGENAGLIALEYGFEPTVERSSNNLVARPPPEDVSSLPPRPPVVTIMGHVDHGKTTLLDFLRKSSVAASEHGGITQHIGAFSVSMPSGKIITFLDTPGHAAFLNMRQRGANVTDIVILVVAADDSVKPQTIEAINHAKAARVPIVVAINKIDKPDANSERVKQDLARHGVDVEDFGGDVQAVEVSGKTGQGMSELEETVTTLSEVLDMRAETDGPAEGWVLEASIKAMGKVATVLVRRGTMRPGDVIVAGNTWAKIRVLRNEAGVEISEATPGTPVEIDGWKDQPTAGDEVLEAPSEAVAKDVVDHRLEKLERDKLAEDMEAINEHRKQTEEERAEEKRKALLEEEERQAEEDAARAGKVEGVKEAFFIIKADVSGSIEAVVDSVSAIGNKEVVPNILRSGVGQLTEFDVEHAATAKGTLINFNTPIDPSIAGLAERSKVTILDHNVIYRLVDDVKLKMSEYLAPSITQRVLGEAEVADVFNITIKGRQQKAVAGVKVRNGSISKNSSVRVLRGGEKIYDGQIASLKNLKKDVLEMRRGTECGMGFEKWTDFQVGDQIQTYETKIEKRYL